MVGSAHVTVPRVERYETVKRYETGYAENWIRKGELLLRRAGYLESRYVEEKYKAEIEDGIGGVIPVEICKI